MGPDRIGRRRRRRDASCGPRTGPPAAGCRKGVEERGDVRGRVAHEAGRIFLAIAVAATLTAFLTGLYAVFNNRDKLLTTISFCTSFLTFLFYTISTFPWVRGRLRDVLRPLLHVVVAALALYLIPLSWLVLQEPVIEIGVSLPFDGPDKADAVGMFKAVTQAVDTETAGTWRVNNYAIRLLPFDDSQMAHNQVRPVHDGTVSGDSEDITSITSDARVAGIIGPFNSGVAAGEIPPAARASLALISPAATADCLTTLRNLPQDTFDECVFDGLARGNRTFLRMASVDTVRAQAFAEYCREQRLGANAAIFDDGSFFGRSFAKRLQEAWHARMGTDVPVSELTDDPREDLQRLRTRADMVVFSGTGAEAIALHEAMKGAGYADTAFAGPATIMRGGVADVSTRADIYAMSPYADFQGRPAYGEFYANFRNDPSEPTEPTPYSAGAYDATRVLMRAIETAVRYAAPPVARLDVALQAERFHREVMHDIRLMAPHYDGVTGSFEFDADGDATDLSHEPAATIYRHERGTENAWHPVGSS
jgi:branched-chain amino acid transport system substrate-binding protein